MAVTKVFVGSLPPTIDEATFRQLFEPYGNINSTVCNPAKRYGFVIYSSMEEAQAAINAMAGFNFEGQCITVKLADNQGGPTTGGPWASSMPAMSTMAHPASDAGSPAGMDAASQATSIYVKGLPANMTAESVRATFAPYGSVLDCKVLVACGQSNDGTGQSVAIVRMGSVTEANWLVENLNGNIPEGLTRAVEVSFKGQKPEGSSAAIRYSPYGGGAPAAPALPYPVPEIANGHGGHAAAANEYLIPGMAQTIAACPPSSKLYVKNLPLTADDLYLYKAFSPFGCVLSAKALPKEGYVIGFVQYSSDAEALSAITALNGHALIDGSVLQVSIKTAKGT